MENEDRVLDWAPNFDPRSRNFPIRATIVIRPARRNKLWTIGPILNQGFEGACVGFGWTAEALSTPVAVNLSAMKVKVPTEPNTFARALYKRAQLIDEWAGEAYEGTSVNAGAKVMREYGLLREYRWAFSIDDVVDAVLAKGPVVLGIKWFESMYNAPDGVLKVSGNLVGGHCITVVGYRVAKDAKQKVDSFILQNSWGPTWGVNGLAEISVADLSALLKNDGEACVPLTRSYGR
jgi:hypothetical protein